MNEKQTGNIVTNGINSRSLWAEAWLRFKRNRVAVAGLIFVAFLIVVSIATLVLDLVTSNEIYNTYVVKQNLSLKLAPPSAEHVFGCDEYGRDILFRLIWGTRYSLFIGVVSIAIALVGGGILGSIAGFYGGKVDQIIMRVMDVFLSIPSMVMAIAIVSALGSGMTNLLLSIAVPQIPRLARIVRASVMSVKDREFVEAARSVGAAILSIAGLSFLGIGVQPPAPEWGSILNAARTYMRDAWHISVIPGLMIMITVLSLNVAGDGLRDALDPKLKN